jgi:putative addiction module component (TIGR02574 family)
MTEAAKKIFEEVSLLDADERIELIETLNGEFGPRDADVEQEWADEIKRRVDDLRSGKTKTIPWEVVRAELGLPPRDS